MWMVGFGLNLCDIYCLFEINDDPKKFKLATIALSVMYKVICFNNHDGCDQNKKENFGWQQVLVNLSC